MKKMFILITVSLILTSQAFAADCRLRASVKERFNCMTISVKFKVVTQEECESLVQSAKDTRFFNTMEKGDELLAIKMTYKQKKPHVKVIKKFEYLDPSEHCY